MKDKSSMGFVSYKETNVLSTYRNCIRPKKKHCTKQAWYWLAEGKQTLLVNNKPAWYKVVTLDE